MAHYNLALAYLAAGDRAGALASRLGRPWPAGTTAARDLSDRLQREP